MKSDLELASLLYLGKLLSNDSFYTEELEDAYISLKGAIETKNKLEKRINNAIEYLEKIIFWYEHNDNICSLKDNFKNDLLSILKGER